MKPIVAIVGRPNVGKSSFFNRLTRTKNAIVDDFPGVTRDRHYGNAKCDDIEFTLIDTGGFIESHDELELQIRYQIHEAIESADVIIFMLDGKSGVSPFDKELAEMLRAVKKPVFYVINKIDGYGHESKVYEFYNLGIDKLYSVSSEHGYGIRDFSDELIKAFPKSDISQDLEINTEENKIRLAVVGRPNVGKSSLINCILGEDRLIVSQIPGTTRDAVDVVCNVNGKSYILIDTAGIRRKGKLSYNDVGKLEKFSVIKALKSLEQCDIALIVLDAHEGIKEQDINIAGYAYERGCGCIFLLNKWDLIEKKDKQNIKKYYDELKTSAKFLSFAPALTISALTKFGILNIFNLADEVFTQHSARISTGQLNKIIEQAIERNEPSLHNGKRIKIYYSTQIAVKPPTFVCFVNYPDAVHFSYERYLINQIREQAGLDKIPIRIFFRGRK